MKDFCHYLHSSNMNTRRSFIVTCSSSENSNDEYQSSEAENSYSDDKDDWGTSSSEMSNILNESETDVVVKERDLFIPIVSIVSLLGLFGAYGYEMLRLYSRGELYLPWNNE